MFRIGIIGAGWIADKMAEALAPLADYQVYECRRCIEQGLLETPMMPHAETIAIMKQMDALRAEWGVKYPMD